MHSVYATDKLEMLASPEPEHELSREHIWNS